MSAGSQREAPRRQIAIYGKGGIGKSTTVSNLAVLFGMRGHDVLLVGCDPKHDTSYKVCDVRPVPTVLGLLAERNSHDLRLEDFFIEGRHGVSCIEAGGPEPGIGCAGRGLSKMFELFESMHLYDGSHDVVLYDVLGDVVCGGFAVPMRKAYASEVLIVVSGEIMSLYAANNICRALVRLASSGVRLGGLIANLRGVDGEEEIIAAFAERLGTRVLPAIPRDQAILRAELSRKTVVEHAPDAPASDAYRRLFEAVVALVPQEGVVPRAMSEAGFDELVRTRLGPLLAGGPTEEPPPGGLQPGRLSTWLAKALTTTQVHCRDVLFEADGHLSLHLARGDERVTLLLGPASPTASEVGERGRDRGQAQPFVELSAGRLRPASAHDAAGPFREVAGHVARRLEALRERYRVPHLELLRLDAPGEVFTFGPGLFKWRIGDLLVPGETRYGPYVYAGERFDGRSLTYRFESGRGAVSLRLDMTSGAEAGGAAASDGRALDAAAGDPCASWRTHHLTLRLVLDEREDEERARPEHQVERYLGYLVSLCDPPSARYALPHRTEAVVAGSTQDWGADLALQFFSDPGYDFLANYYTAFGLEWPVAYLFHGERECSAMGDYGPGPFQSFVEHPMHVRPALGMSERVFITDLRDTDAVMGGEARLRSALHELGNRDGIETVIVQDTCMVRVIGDDVRRCLETVQPEVRARLIYLDATAMDEAAPFEAISAFWRALLESRAEGGAARAADVNLVGYGMRDAAAPRELAALLAKAGVQVGACLFPGLDREGARRFRSAAANVVTPWRYAERAFEDAARWSGLPSVVAPLPYGRRGTRRFLEAVATAVAGEGSAQVERARALDLDERDRARLEALRLRAAAFPVAFTLVSTQGARLLDAPGFLGAPLPAFLAELGFPLRILCHDPERVRATRDRIAPEALEAGLRALAGEGARVDVVPFADPSALPGLLRDDPAALFYSELRDDPRLAAAGKAQISIVDFEMGFGGALRTAERLLRRARPPLGRRLGQALQRGGAA